MTSDFSRRRALELGAAVAASTILAKPAVAGPPPASMPLLSATSPGDGAPMPTINPRSAWAGDLAPTGPLDAEDDVRFLLVHHTASTNDYGPDEVADQIRGFYRFHTGPEKQWPDVAYNFFVDRYGGIWEARAGSIDGAVRGSATGGSQGFALLCSLIGDHAAAPVTNEARTSLVALLAWLADRHAIDTTPGATTSFVSRGSSRWPAGAEVEARTISGHREMSTTSCPGDFAFDLLADAIPSEVTELRVAAATAVATTETTTTEATTSTSEPDESTDDASTTTEQIEEAPSTTADDPAQSNAAGPENDTSGDDETAADPPSVEPDQDGISWPLVGVGGALGVAAAAGGAVTWARNRSGDDSGGDSTPRTPDASEG
ncbi:MAG: peptidoglycan recognition family protein [Actinomycetota bacterium]